MSSFDTVVMQNLSNSCTGRRYKSCSEHSFKDSLSPLSNSLLCSYSFITDITIPNDTTEMVACSMNFATYFISDLNRQNSNIPPMESEYVSDYQFSVSISH